MIGIVGGGISGLAVAHFLAEREAEFVLLEADDEPGGVMRTHRVEGAEGAERAERAKGDEAYPLDTGPQRTRVTEDVRELIAAAGLDDAVLVAPEEIPLHVYRLGRLREVPLGPGAALRTDLLSWRGKLRMLLEPLKEGPRDDETVARYLTRSFGKQAYERMLGPYYGGLYGSDPARMYVRHGLRTTLDHFGVRGSLLVAFLRRGARARKAIETVSFEGGMQALPNGLAARHRARIRLGSRVTAIRRAGSGRSGRSAGSGGSVGSVGSVGGVGSASGRISDSSGDVRETAGVGADTDTGIDTDTGEGVPQGRRISASRGTVGDTAGAGFILEVDGSEPVRVDRVVLSLSAPQAAAVLAGLAPEASARIGRLRYNRLAVVHMVAVGENGQVPELRGAGYQVAFDEPMETRGVTWNGALFGRGGLCAAYLGGMRHPELVEWDDDRIADVALREFTTATGLEARLLKVSRTWIPAWDETWDALDGLELPRGIHLCANWNARPGIPGRAAAARRIAGELATVD